MTSIEQSAIVLHTAIHLRSKGSWAGETHIQKAVFLLQKLLSVQVGFDFVLYKHGPFSFDLRERLHEMEAERLIRLEEQPYPYGPRIVVGTAEPVLRRATHKAEQYHRQIEFVALQLGDASVSTLERIATALYVALDSSIPVGDRADRLVELKPHVQMHEAQAAFRRIEEIRDAAVHAGLLPVAACAHSFQGAAC